MYICSRGSKIIIVKQRVLSRLFLSRERNNESGYFIYILKRYFMSTYNYEVRPREGFQADPGEGESRQEDAGGSRGDPEKRLDLGVGIGLTACSSAKKEESESERSARKEIRALVDFGQFQTRRWTVSHAISVSLLSLSSLLFLSF